MRSGAILQRHSRKIWRDSGYSGGIEMDCGGKISL